MGPAGVATAPGALVFLCSGPATLTPSFPGACPPPKEEYWLVQAVGVVSGGGGVAAHHTGLPNAWNGYVGGGGGEHSITFIIDNRYCATQTLTPSERNSSN